MNGEGKKESFEASLMRLEEIVEQMEGAALSLDDALALYKEGAALSKACGEILGKAQQQVQKITELSSGEYKLTEFTESEQE